MNKIFQTDTADNKIARFKNPAIIFFLRLFFSSKDLQTEKKGRWPMRSAQLHTAVGSETDNNLLNWNSTFAWTYTEKNASCYYYFFTSHLSSPPWTRRTNTNEQIDIKPQTCCDYNLARENVFRVENRGKRKNIIFFLFLNSCELRGKYIRELTFSWC